MGRLLALAYGAAAYVAFLGSILFAIGFVTGIAVPKTVDTGPIAPIGEALAINILLLSLFPGWASASLANNRREQMTRGHRRRRPEGDGRLANCIGTGPKSGTWIPSSREKRHRRHALRHVGPKLAEKEHQRHVLWHVGPEFADQGQGRARHTDRRHLESVAELGRKGTDPKIQWRAAMMLRCS
jgi:hypothetical protein